MCVWYARIYRLEDERVTSEINKGANKIIDGVVRIINAIVKISNGIAWLKER